MNVSGLCDCVRKEIEELGMEPDFYSPESIREDWEIWSEVAEMHGCRLVDDGISGIRFEPIEGKYDSKTVNLHLIKAELHQTSWGRFKDTPEGYTWSQWDDNASSHIPGFLVAPPKEILYRFATEGRADFNVDDVVLVSGYYAEYLEELISESEGLPHIQQRLISYRSRKGA